MIGILGGMGPRATVQFQKLLLDMCTGGDQNLPAFLCINDGSIPDRTAYLMRGGADPLPAMSRRASMLEQAGASIICVPCNTAQTPELHRRLAETVSVPLIHMPTLVVEEIKGQKVRRVLLLATEGTVKSGMYQQLCERQGISCAMPSENMQRLVSDLIQAVKTNNESAKQYASRVLRGYIATLKVEGVILGCTELPLVAKDLEVEDVTQFDSLAILARACIRFDKEMKGAVQ